MYIESSAIDNHRPEYLVSLHCHYCQCRERESDGDVARHTVRTLGEKIVQHFRDRVKLDYSSRKKGSVLYSSKANKELALSMASKCSTTEEHTVGEAACILCSVILKICKSAPDLPTALSLEDFKKGKWKFQISCGPFLPPFSLDGRVLKTFLIV